MTDTIRSVISYVFVIGVLVFFHELGHFAAARWRGVVVEVFSIGFGPALLSWRAKSGTIWKLSALPLGGYVKMQGWGQDESTLPVRPGSFASASLGAKAFIVVAGPAANLVLAFLLFAGLFAIQGQPVAKPVVAAVMAGSAAARGGLLPGDTILSVDGHKVHDFNDMVPLIMAHPDMSMAFVINRAGVLQTRAIMIGEKVVDGVKVGSLGIGGDTVIQHYSAPGAVAAAARETWSDSAATVAGLYALIVHQTGLRQLHGMIGIAQITGKVAAFGFPSLINLLALLSINLGLINLVPIPVLDGGHLLFYAGEAIIRRPIPRIAQDIGMRIGIAVVLSLVIFTNFNDLTQLGAVRWVAHLFG